LIKPESSAPPGPSQAKRLEASKKLGIEAARLAHHTRCHNVIILDMANVSAVTDFHVIATGTSARQMRSVCDEIDELAATMGFPSFHRSGYEGETWIAVDYVDVVLHIFNQEARLYYDLENLWGDAKRVEWK
jgi:ribosome-associated protein